LLSAYVEEPWLIAVLSGHQAPVYALAFGPVDNTMATRVRDGKIVFWDIDKKTPMAPSLAAQAAGVTHLAFSPDGRILASVCLNGGFVLWDVSACRPRTTTLSIGEGGVNTLAFSPDGATLMMGRADGKLALWDIASSQPIGPPDLADSNTVQPVGPWKPSHSDSVTSLVFSPDGTILASASLDGTIRLWDVAGRRPLDPPFVGHQGRVNGLPLVLTEGPWPRSVRIDRSPSGTSRRASEIPCRSSATRAG
jgi:WD40 repeat protein